MLNGDSAGSLGAVGESLHAVSSAVKTISGDRSVTFFIDMLEPVAQFAIATFNSKYTRLARGVGLSPSVHRIDLYPSRCLPK